MPDSKFEVIIRHNLQYKIVSEKSDNLASDDRKKKTLTKY